MTQRVFHAGLIPVGFQKSTLSNSTAVSLNSTVRGGDANVLHVSVETQSVRYRTDGTNPTLTTGVLLTAAAGPYWFYGWNGTSSFKFIRATGSAVVSIMAYKQAGSNR